MLADLNIIDVKYDDVKMHRQEANRSGLLREIGLRGVQGICLYIYYPMKRYILWGC